MSASENEVRVYVRPEGAETPPLLMTPPASWTVKTFAKVGVRSVGLSAPASPRVTNVRTDQELDLGIALGDAGLMPYDLLVIQDATAQ